MGIKADLAQNARNLAQSDVGITLWSDNLQSCVLKASDSDVGVFVVALAVLQSARNERLSELSRRYNEAREASIAENFVKAQQIYESLGDYSDSKQQAKQAAAKERKRIKEQEERRKEEKRIQRQHYAQMRSFQIESQLAELLPERTKLRDQKERRKEAQSILNSMHAPSYSMASKAVVVILLLVSGWFVMADVSTLALGNMKWVFSSINAQAMFFGIPCIFVITLVFHFWKKNQISKYENAQWTIKHTPPDAEAQFEKVNSEVESLQKELDKLKNQK